MKKPQRLSAGFGVVALSLVVTLLPSHASAAGDPVPEPVLTDADIQAMDPEAQNQYLAPLRDLADAVATVGASSEKGSYAGVRIEGGTRSVTLYLTDTGRKSAVVDAARKLDPAIDPAFLRVKQAAHTRGELEAARGRLTDATRRLGITITGIAAPQDGSGLRVDAPDPDAVRRALAMVPASRTASALDEAGVPVETAQEDALVATSRARDTAPWMAGAKLTNNYGASCTSGLPTVRISDGRPFLVTAAHCFSNGNSVYTGSQNGGRNYVGQVTARANHVDAIAIDTKATGRTWSWEWDGPQNSNKAYKVTSVRNSTERDPAVCHDGYTSGVVCGIKVKDADYMWWMDDDLVFGVKGERSAGTSARPGDSGGLVFAISGSTTRQARGIVSAVGLSNDRIMVWPEAPEILYNFGLRMAPTS
ncbi:hypothetical protein [Embleya sp. NBC_00896]|uniref:hypothetical protein n=1 Tax=Embleya sp. NBC_00896 TaxID=2975961 RepID=UPI003869E22D|nr:S1 family peptidase [Embleya sp. NBC_00896]